MDAGLHNITAEVYHSDPCDGPSLSSSLLKILLSQSPAHAKLAHPKLNPFHVEQSDSKFDVGTAAHAMLLEGLDNIVICDADDWRTKAAKEVRDQARAAGHTCLLRRHYDETVAMVHVAKDFMARKMPGFATDAHAEMSAIWQEDGVWFRARPDKLLLGMSGPARILDYKTTSSPNPGAFIRASMTNFGYDIQDAFYRRGLAALGLGPATFTFMVQEDSAPFACYLVESGASMREVAERKVERGIALWKECLAAGQWPGYPEDIYFAEAQAWAATEEFSK